MSDPIASSPRELLSTAALFRLFLQAETHHPMLNSTITADRSYIMISKTIRQLLHATLPTSALLILFSLQLPAVAHAQSGYKALVCVFLAGGNDGNNQIAQSQETTVTPGRFYSFDFNRDELAAEGELGTGRLQVRIEIRYRLASAAESDDRIIVKSAPLGLTRGETLRISVFNPNEPEPPRDPSRHIQPGQFPASLELVDSEIGRTTVYIRIDGGVS